MLRKWLSNQLSDTLFSDYVSENVAPLSAQTSRTKYLKLKHLDRGIGREILNEISPCEVCGKAINSESEFFALRDGPSFSRIARPSYVERVPNIDRPPYNLVSYWQCKQCGSVTEYITQEKSSYGKWRMVG